MAPVCEGEEAAALLSNATALETVPVRRTACRTLAGAAVLLLAMLLVAMAAATRSGRNQAGASVASGLTLWSAHAQIRERVTPVSINGGVMPLASPPSCLVGDLPGLWSYDAEGPSVQVKLLTYNLFWWNLYEVRKGNHGSAGRLIAKANHAKPHDIMAFQECMDVDRVLEDAGLAGAYAAFPGDGSKTAAICMAFRKRSWTLLGNGSAYVAEDTKAQYFGRRAAQWMRLLHMASGRVLFFMNHHGPLPVNSGGQCGGAGTAYNLLQIIATHAQRGDAIILGGDFNADATSVTIRHLKQKLHKAFSGTVVNGIDNIFSNLGAAAVVSAANLGNGGSDHDALSVTLALGSPRGTPPKLHLPRPHIQPVLAGTSPLLQGSAAAPASAVTPPPHPPALRGGLPERRPGLARASMPQRGDTAAAPSAMAAARPYMLALGGAVPTTVSVAPPSATAPAVPAVLPAPLAGPRPPATPAVAVAPAPESADPLRPAPSAVGRPMYFQ